MVGSRREYREQLVTGAMYKELAQSLDRESGLLDIKKDYALAGKGPTTIAERHGLGLLPMNLKPDLVFVYKDNPLAETIIAAAEIKVPENFDKADIYEGWNQVMGYGMFGFHGLALWHLFTETPADEALRKYRDFGQHMSKLWNLGIWFFAGHVDVDAKTVTYYNPMPFKDFVKWILGILAGERVKDRPSPLESDSGVMKRRAVVMADLRIPR